ncbi:hypothetical protein AB837_00352 [bacterium AB1]|nr:hypothetical protein AB837_00352 [bacterium AB1]
MKKNFNVTDFLKKLESSKRFMNSLERNSENKNNDNAKRILVPMHVLSKCTLIENIKTYEDIKNFITDTDFKEKKFNIIVHIFNESKKIYIEFPFNIENYKNIENIKIKKVTLEYLLLYEVASPEAKKRIRSNE